MKRPGPVPRCFHHHRVSLIQPQTLTAYLLQDGVQQRHVGLLRLDGVREEAVGLVGDERVDGHLLHAHDDRCLADVLLDLGSGVAVGLAGMTSSVSCELPSVSTIHNNVTVVATPAYMC